jgi:hypothetical protein
MSGFNERPGVDRRPRYAVEGEVRRLTFRQTGAWVAERRRLLEFEAEQQADLPESDDDQADVAADQHEFDLDEYQARLVEEPREFVQAEREPRDPLRLIMGDGKVYEFDDDDSLREVDAPPIRSEDQIARDFAWVRRFRIPSELIEDFVGDVMETVAKHAMTDSDYRRLLWSSLCWLFWIALLWLLRTRVFNRRPHTK